ncbi:MULTISPECIES: hypothetical protein [Streptomyces]|uniref:Uncharacterized protein n=1 Tax=Streptomyces katrae TaxID=68223 RepID=A0A0F4J847_9ACTN|nr:hypothetical protein [Streptomyces katrae]KJY29954.1 hypothetical protein VR44_21525 [Streptomyces katrae]
MRPVTVTTFVQYASKPGTDRWHEPISVDVARQCLRRARRSGDTVEIRQTTARDGSSVHVAHVHIGPGRWRDVDSVTDIYEIPTDALTDL